MKPQLMTQLAFCVEAYQRDWALFLQEDLNL